MTPWNVKGILFDKDGTLLDFQATWAGVVETLLQELAPDADLRDRMARDVGFDLTSRRFTPGSPIVAGSTEESARIWARSRPDLGAGRIEDLANGAADRAVFHGALSPVVPDLADFLSRLRAQGYVMGIATHDTEAAARTQLTSLGAIAAFDFIAGYDSGHGLKPGPGMLLAFAAATGLAPEQIIMVGDSIHDLGVGPSAGAAFTVGVLTGPAGPEDLRGYADHILPSIADLPALLDRLSGAH